MASKSRKYKFSHLTRTRKHIKTMRKGGGKDVIIRGGRADFQRILNIIKSQYEILAHSTKGVVFNDKVNRFVMNAETTMNMDLINRKHELKLLSSKIVYTLPSNHPLLFDLSFTSSEIALIQEYCPEEKLLIVENVSYKLPRWSANGPFRTSHEFLPNTVLVEGNLADFFGTNARLHHMSLQGKFDQLIVERGASADLIDFVEGSKYLLDKLQSKIMDEIEYQMDLYIYKKIDPFTGHMNVTERLTGRDKIVRTYNETLTYSISFTEDEYSFLRKEVGSWYISNQATITTPSDTSVPDYLDTPLVLTAPSTGKVIDPNEQVGNMIEKIKNWKFDVDDIDDKDSSETPRVAESKMAYEPEGMSFKPTRRKPIQSYEDELTQLYAYTPLPLPHARKSTRSETPRVAESKMDYGPPVIPYGFIRPPVIPQKTVPNGGMRRTRRKIRVIKCKPTKRL